MSVRNAANPAIWLVSGMCGMFDIRTATAGGIRRCVMSSRSHRSLRYNVSLNCHVTLPFFYVKNKFWLVLRRRLSQRKVVLLPRRNRKLRWEKKKKKTSALYRLRKPSKCWIHNRQYAKVYLKKNTTNGNTVRTIDYDLNVSKKLFFEVGEKIKIE